MRGRLEHMCSEEKKNNNNRRQKGKKGRKDESHETKGMVLTLNA